MNAFLGRSLGSFPEPVGLLLGASVKGIIVFLAAAVAALALRRGPAAARHLVWSLAVAGLAFLPLLGWALPPWSVPLFTVQREEGPAVACRHPIATPAATAALPTGPSAAAIPYLVTEAAASPQTGSGLVADAVAEPTPPPAPAARPWPGSVDWPLLAWALVALVVAWPVVLALVSLRRLRWRARPVTDGAAPALLRQLCGEVGLRRPVLLLQCPWRVIPMTWGLFRPVILLPGEAEAWSAERLRVVLRHELAHIRRLDCLTQVLAHLVCAVYWFNPLAWLAAWRMRVEQERACDDVVLQAGSAPADYAEDLLTIASCAPSRYHVAPVSLTMGRAGRIRRRLESVLDPDRDRRPLTRRLRTLAVAAAVCLVLPLASLGLSGAAGREPGAAGEAAGKEVADKTADTANKLADVGATVLQRYVKAPDQKEVLNGAIKGMIDALHDPYSEYLPAERLAEMEKQISGAFSGIGAQLRVKDNKLTILTPLEDSPALKAGLRAGDVIVAIDGKPAGADLTAAIKRIAGPQGTVVKVKVVHAGGREEELAVTRAAIKVRTVRGFRRGAGAHWDFFLDPDHKVGYVHVLQLGPETAKEVRQAVERLQAGGLKGLILDLRFCPGGLLPAAVETAGLFLTKGTILTVKGRGIDEQAWQADGKSALADFPLVVLLNEQTASAGEIVAGALKDNDRAVLIGTRSHGKGSVQDFIKLEDTGGALKLTVGYYLLPSGRNIQRRPGERNWGVDPTDGDYVPLSGNQVEALLKVQQAQSVIGNEPTKQEKVTPQALEDQYADPQLAAALRAMTSKLTTGAFEKVGKSNAVMLATLGRLEEARKRREQLLKSLEQVNQEVADLEKTVGAEKPEEKK
jgi:carboxyl-terminal processing protease